MCITIRARRTGARFRRALAGLPGLLLLLLTSLFAMTTPASVAAAGVIRPAVVIIQPNQPPWVTLDTPSDSATFVAPADVVLTATSNDPDASFDGHPTVSRVTVDFLVDGNIVSSDFPGPDHRYAWNAVPAGHYTIVARATDPLGAVTETAPIHIDVREPVVHLTVTAAASSLTFKPGVALSVPILAVDDAGQVVANTLLHWNVALSSAATTKSACSAADAPASGDVRTDSAGRANIDFLPGCRSANRELKIVPASSPGNALIITLHGPDDLAGGIALTSGVSFLVLPPSSATPISFMVKDTHDLPIAGSTLVFSLLPTNAGTIDASAVVNDNGIATTTLKLNAAVASATLSACVQNRPGLCLLVPVRNTTGAIAAPAAALLGPMVQQALDAPAAQFTNIGNHLRVLRNDSGHGFSREVSVSAAGGSIPLGNDADGHKATGDSHFSVFASGDVDLGKRDSNGSASDGFHATTRGVTLGIDYRVSPAIVVGAALGAMRSNTDVADGSNQHAHGVSGSLYAQWLPTEKAYVSSALNLGHSQFDASRSACPGVQLRSKTDGDHRALMLEAGYSFARDSLRLTPFLRYQYVHAALDALHESGICLDAMDIDATQVNRSSVSAGASLDRVFSTRNGVWIPGIDIEYLSQSQQQDAIFARLVAGGPSTPVTLGQIDRRYAIARFSLSWMTSIRAQPISAFAGFDTSIGRSDYDSRTFMLGVKIPF